MMITADYPYWPAYEKYQKAQSWCQQMFGRDFETSNTGFHFYNEKDYIMFMLKWS